MPKLPRIATRPGYALYCAFDTCRRPPSPLPGPGLPILKINMRYLLVCLLALVAPLASEAIARGSAPGKIVTIERKVRTTVQMYIVSTPLMKDEPYCEIQVDLQGYRYLAEYDLRDTEETLPENWVAGETVKVRLQGRKLFVERPGGAEVGFTMTRKKPIPAAAPNKSK